MFDHDLAIADWAHAHLGIISYEECRSLGVSHAALMRRTSAGILVPEFNGVYRHRAVPTTPESRIRAAVLASGGLALASGPSAMRLYGVRGRWRDAPEVTIVGKGGWRLPGIDYRRVDRIDGQDIEARYGIAVLAPALALLLLGASVPADRVEAATHDMVHLGLVDKESLRDVLSRYGGRGRRGCAALRAALRDLPDRTATETNLELALLRLLRSCGLPEPTPQFVVVDANGVERRLDLAYVPQRVALECDGGRWHTAPRDRAADERRDRALAAVGWQTLRFGDHDIHHQPAATIAAIRRSLAAEDRRAV